MNGRILLINFAFKFFGSAKTLFRLKKRHDIDDSIDSTTFSPLQTDVFSNIFSLENCQQLLLIVCQILTIHLFSKMNRLAK